MEQNNNVLTKMGNILTEMNNILTEMGNILISILQINAEENFCNNCYTGNLHIAKKIYKNNYFYKYYFNYEKTLRYCCKNGQLKSAKWIVNITDKMGFSYITMLKTNNSFIHSENELQFYRNELFQDSCMNGHLHIAKWLLSIQPTINISSLNEWAFRYSFYNGKFGIVKWLLKKKPNINIFSIDNSFGFVYSFTLFKYLKIQKIFLHLNHQKCYIFAKSKIIKKYNKKQQLAKLI